MAVAAVGDQLVRILRYARVQIVHDHVHDGGGVFGFRRIHLNGIGPTITGHSTVKV